MSWTRVKNFCGEFFTNIFVNMRLMNRPLPPAEANVAGQTIIVTGSNRGIGKEVVKDLAKRGAKILMACRDVNAAESVANEIKRDQTDANIQVYPLDLADFDSIRSCAEKIKRDHKTIDVLVNNSGIMTKDRRETRDGLETMIAVNYFGTVLFTLLLFDNIKKSSFPRILFVSSLAHWTPMIRLNDLNWKYGPYINFKVYGHSKAVLMLFLQKFAQKAHEHGVRVYGIDPGVSATDLGREMIKPNLFTTILRTIIRPLLRSIPLAGNSVLLPILFTKENDYNPSQFHYVDGRVQDMSPLIKDGPDCEKLWDITKETIKMESIMDNL